MSIPNVKPDSILQNLVKISLLIYPLIAHIGILMDQVIWSVCYLLVVVYFNSLKLFYQHRLIGVGFSLLMCVLVYFLFRSEMHVSIMYLPPVLIPVWLAFVFIGSMRTESALISKIAERIEGKPLDQKHLRYTRQLTAVWGIVFVLMVCEAVVLALWASHEMWSWWVHIGNYFVIAILFLVEMMMRHKLSGQRVNINKMLGMILSRNWQA